MRIIASKKGVVEKKLLIVFGFVDYITGMSESDTVTIRIGVSVLDALNKQRKERKQPLTACVDTAVNLWLSLPVAIQAELMAGQGTGEELQNLIRLIVDEKLKHHR